MTIAARTKDQSRAIKKAWRNWALAFAPLMAAIVVAQVWLGFSVVFPVILAVLCMTLLYQRFVKKRTWHSIFWGVYATQD